MMSFPKFMEWAFLGLVAGGVWILYLMKNDISDLNFKVGIVIEQRVTDRKTLDDHEVRIRNLEAK
jgi:hypothetical protein